MNYNELEVKWNYPKEITDKTELNNFNRFYNDFTKQLEYNDCLKLVVEDYCYKGSDIQFEQILRMFPNHKFEIIKSDNKYVTNYEGYLESEKDDYFKLEYKGGWLSKFDLVHITIKGSKEAFETIKHKYNLI